MKYLAIILLIIAIMLSACAQQPAAEQRETPPAQAPQDVPSPQEAKKPGEAMMKAEVNILGKDGFEPMDLTIDAGTTVVFISKLEKTDTLVFKMEGKANTENTDKIAAGGIYEKTFTEPGTYEYWAVGFGPKGAKIVVE